ncbi:MAG: DUF4198 domain-containing protein [Desulfobacteraceae bacterium]
MKKLSLFTVMMLIFTAAPVQGHSLWFNVANREAKVGQPVIVELGWGHKFPKDTEIKDGMLNQIFALGPEGQKIPLKPLSKTRFEWAPSRAGLYTLSARVHPGFVSKTTKGYKMGPKTEFKQVLSCFHYDLRGKTYIDAGDENTPQIQAIGDPLEILPMTTPLGLRTGDVLPVRILLEGKPLAGATVHATYAGFSDQPHTFVQTLQTDAEGKARVTLNHAGDWFIAVTHEIPYPDKTECDTQKYNATLTFGVE